MTATRSRRGGREASITLEGTLVGVRVQRGAWFVGVLRDDDNREHAITGTALSGVPTPGSKLSLLGRFEESSYGPQFRFDSLMAVIPETREGAISYLATFDGIGPVSAERIVDALGETAPAQILADPSCLARVPGLRMGQAESVAAQVASRRETAQVDVLLHQMGFGPGIRRRIAEHFGERLAHVLQHFPYDLVDVPRVSFTAVDNALMHLGHVQPHDPLRATAAIAHVLMEQSRNGHTWLTEATLATELGKLRVAKPFPPDAIALGLEKGAERGKLRRVGEAAWATPAIAEAEEFIAARLVELAAEQSEFGSLADVPEGILAALVEEQRAALDLTMRSKVMVLTGGPGTGKTYTLNAILRALGPQARDSGGIIVVAPTGKAAKRAQDVTGHPAMTVHRFCLSSVTEEMGIPRVVVCEESSMADVELFAMLLRATMRDDLRLVVVGDVNQLPSVGPGRVLADILASGVVPTVRLTRIMRQAEGSRIITNAHRINRGERPDLSRSEAGDWFTIMGSCGKDAHDDEKQAEQRELVQRIVGAVEYFRGRGLDPMRQVQVLSGQRQGELGVARLNQVLRDRFNPASPSKPEVERYGERFRVGDKMMVTANDYGLGVVNGDTGVIAAVVPADKEREQKLGVLLSLDDGRTVLFEDDAIDTIKHAFAMTVHKSQGSEYEAVVVVMHSSLYWACQRCLLYTAVTRGRRHVVLVGNHAGLHAAIQNSSPERRNTRLRGLMQATAEARGMAVGSAEV